MYDSPIYLVEHEIEDVYKESNKRLGKALEDNVLRKVVAMDIDIDKEKLIKALEQDKQRYEEAYQKGYDIGFADGKAMEVAEEQKPRPVKIIKNEYNNEFYYCPNCGRGFDTTYYKRPLYCDKCGQAVKWYD